MSRTIQEIFAKEENKKILKTGVRDFDQTFKGLVQGSINVFSGRPGMGQTSVLLRMAKGFHKENKWPIYWVTYSDSFIDIAKRYYHINESESQFDEHKPKENLDKYDHFRVESKVALDDIQTWIANKLEENEKALFIFDGIEAFDQPINDATTQKVKENIKELSGFIQDKNCVILFSFNCSVDSENRGGTKRPQLWDLPFLDQYLNYINKAFGVWRPEYYGFEQDEEGDECSDLLYVSGLYNKTGDTKEIKVLHRGGNKKMEVRSYIYVPGLELKYGEQFITVKEQLKGHLIKIENNEGYVDTSWTCESIEDCWSDLIHCYKMHDKPFAWLDFEIRDVNEPWTKFLLKKLVIVYESPSFFEDDSLKQKYDYWMNQMVY